MKNITRHIAILLTAVFTVTFLPFNAFHHHEEDVHTAALIGHETGHFCELDERFCQDVFTGDCGHQSHLHSSELPCFSCQFHFIKTFTVTYVYRLAEPVQTGYFYSAYRTAAVCAYIQQICNKGPPTFLLA